MAPNAVAGYRYSSKSLPSKGVLLCVLAWSFVVVEYWIELLGLPVAFYALRYDIIFLYDLREVSDTHLSILRMEELPKYK
jgi:hypothetical protein